MSIDLLGLADSQSKCNSTPKLDSWVSREILPHPLSGKKKVADMTYHQLTQEERYRITALLMCGCSARRDRLAVAAPAQHHRTVTAPQCHHARGPIPRREGSQLCRRPPAALPSRGALQRHRHGAGGPPDSPPVRPPTSCRRAAGNGRPAHQSPDDLARSTGTSEAEEICGVTPGS